MPNNRFIVALTLGVLGPWALVCLLASESVNVPYPVVSAKAGERCAICNVALSSDDVALIIKGRRIPLDRHMVAEFLNNQEKYLRSRLVRSALFQEELEAPAGVAQAGLSLTWFLAGLYILAALIFAGLSGYAAVAKGLPPISGFSIGLLFSAPGYLYILTRPSRVARGEVPSGLTKVPVTSSPVACPQCGNTNHPAASRCSVCHASLAPELKSEAARATLSAANERSTTIS